MYRAVVLSLAIGVTLAAHTYHYSPYNVHGEEDGKFPRGLLREEDAATDSYINMSPVQPNIDIFPPKWYPGDILEKTGHGDIDKALDDVMRAGSMMQDRRCAIGIANEGMEHALIHPKWSFFSGHLHSALPYRVDSGSTSLNLFVKQAGMASGTVGVLSYDIENTDFKVAIMWSVPFDFIIYDVWFNMKVYPKSISTDRDLYRHLYYDAGPWRPVGWETREEYGVKLRAVMTDHTHSKLLVWVNSDYLDQNAGYDLYTDCAYHPGWVGKHCTQECHGSGWCWVNKRCSSRAECTGRQVCYSEC